MFCSKKELADVLSVVVFCQSDNTYLLLLEEERGDYWIPSFKMDRKISWKDNLQSFKKLLFDYEIVNEKLLKIYKIWTLGRDYFHLIFQIDLPKEVKTNCKAHTLFGKSGWYTCNQISKLKSSLRSLEILEVTFNYSPQLTKGNEKVTGEPNRMGSLVEIREEDVLITAQNCDNQVYLDLLDSAGIPLEEQYDIYEDFFLQTYPCVYMNHVAFEKLISKFGETKITPLFRAADAWKRGFLTFQDYLLFIAVMEPCTAHYGHLAELRCHYIFRYYDADGDGKLNFGEFRSLLADIKMTKDFVFGKIGLEKNLDTFAKLINFKPNSTMTFEQFYFYVLRSKISDTSLLLRLKQVHYEIFQPSIEKFSFQNSLIPSKILLPPLTATFYNQNGDSNDYKIFFKSTLLKPSESPLRIKDLHFLEGKCGSTHIITDTMTKSVSEDFDVLESIKLMRLDAFDMETKVTELLMALRYFCTKMCTPLSTTRFEEKDSYHWGSANLENLGITMAMMCERLKEILSSEPRLLPIEPPVYIMGDLHGNFHDLMCFEKTLWPNGISLAPAKLLLLGDYVDRGSNSLEVIMYLFAHKIQNPHKIFLVRGNHEIRDIQKVFTFQKECIYKLGFNLGSTIWKVVNDVFDVMPLAAVIDSKIFCCHGGIPPPWLCPVIAVINAIPCPLVNCERQSPLAWNLMWNDPLKNVIGSSIQELELLANEGFVPNSQRGTGYVFTYDALDKFLLTNNLSHVVRAHEVVRAGFQVHQKGKLLTVFSSSGYCGGKNFAASILVADKLLRICMVDTGIH